MPAVVTSALKPLESSAGPAYVGALLSVLEARTTAAVAAMPPIHLRTCLGECTGLLLGRDVIGS
jgi:hypothetical protein